MEFVNYENMIILTDADILQIIKHSPELLQDSSYIKRRYNEIIKILNSLTIINNDITIYDISKSEPVFCTSNNTVLAT